MGNNGAKRWLTGLAVATCPRPSESVKEPLFPPPTCAPRTVPGTDGPSGSREGSPCAPTRWGSAGAQTHRCRQVLQKWWYNSKAACTAGGLFSPSIILHIIPTQQLGIKGWLFLFFITKRLRHTTTPPHYSVNFSCAGQSSGN